ncbi:MAG: hypothetical protein EXX96DRAFT_626596 [Benjaminiella poitrasii]|nr:MAG: hypothetical protein EXX96DRAFT_626596 [Benjaminiella poitrasii]
MTFLPEVVELKAMTTQLRNKGLIDGRYKYQSDGLICVDDLSGLETLLTEISSGYDSSDDSKVSFDHYKEVFGMLSMMRTIAQKYNKGTFDTFRKLKVYFLHGHRNAILHWSMSMQTVGVLPMNKEQRVRYLDGAENLQVIRQLKEEHKAAVNRSQDCKPSLLSFVNPSITGLNEGKHMSIVAEEGLYEYA